MPMLLHAKSSRKVGFSCSVEEGTDVPRHLVARFWSLRPSGVVSGVIRKRIKCNPSPRTFLLPMSSTVHF
jgi:hypothetical protein